MKKRKKEGRRKRGELFLARRNAALRGKERRKERGRATRHAFLRHRYNTNEA